HLHVAIASDLEIEIATLGDEAHVAVAAGAGCRRLRPNDAPLAAGFFGGLVRADVYLVVRDFLARRRRVGGLAPRAFTKLKLRVAAAAHPPRHLIDSLGRIPPRLPRRIGEFADVLLLELLAGFFQADAQDPCGFFERIGVDHGLMRPPPDSW